MAAGAGLLLAIYFLSLLLHSVAFKNKFRWDSSRSWCMPSCPSFLVCPIGLVAGAGVFLATSLFFKHLHRTVAKAGVSLAVHLFF